MSRTMNRSTSAQPALLESLETRQYLSLVGVALQYPVITYDSTGVQAYDPTTEAFDITATPLRFRQTPTSPLRTITGPDQSVAIHIQVDSAGQLIGGVEGDDFVLTGSIDADGNGTIDYSGTLLTGEVIRFGSAPAGNVGNYDFQFIPTGGSLAGLYSGKYIGVTCGAENSTFTGDFSVPFTGHAKGNIGPAAIPVADLGSLAGRVFYDADNSGLDNGEPGIAGVSVQLHDRTGAVVATATTDGNGSYAFAGLIPGTYSITETQPDDYLDGGDVAGSLGGVAGNDVVSNIFVGPGQNGVAYNFGEILPARLAGNVYLDVNDNGLFEPADEPGIPGVTVMLTGTDDLGNVVSQTTTTDDAGAYSFDGLRPGQYALTEIQPAQFLDGRDTIGTPGGLVADDSFIQIMLSAGVDGANNNFGELVRPQELPGSLGDFVWLDANADGIQQIGEAGVAGVTVNLAGADANGQVARTTTTDANGYYLFDQLLPGDYAVTFQQPAGYVFTIADQGSNDADSDADRLTGTTATVTLISGQNDMTWDAGLVLAGISIEKYVKEVTTNGGCGDHDGHDDHNGGCGDHDGHDDHNGGCGDHDGHDDHNGGCGDHDDHDDHNGGCGGSSTWSWSNNGGSCGAGNGWSKWFAFWRNSYSSSCGSVSYVPACCPSPEPEFDPGIDADDAPGLTVSVGKTVKFTYVVTNPGQAPLADVVVTDDNATPNDATDDFAPQAVLENGYNVGDENRDNILQPGEQWLYTATTKVTYGQHTNVAVVVGTPVDAQGRTLGEDVSDNDPANWFGKAKCVAPSSLAGSVYVDCDNDGNFDCGEKPISGVIITLTGTNDLGESVSVTTATDDDGAYLFKNLRPGTYAIQETQPAAFADGKDTLGSLGGSLDNDRFFDVLLAAGKNGVKYNFGERSVASNVKLTCGMTATIGFWNNKNGQALIKSFNGGSCSKDLGNWLAVTFPKLYGNQAGCNNLAGKTNAQIASYFSQLFDARGAKTSAQVLAAALACYVTDRDLAGNAAVKYGFTVSAAGTGVAVYNVGSYGSSLGFANNSQQSVMDLLLAVNQNASNGVIASSQSNAANAVFSGINEKGDIA